MSTPRSTASSVREQKLARVIDREVAPIWHDRFARLLMRELPNAPETFALDIHSGAGHTTAELLQRLDESSRIVALGRDPWLMQVSKTRVRPEWKRRVYFKSGDIDDVTGMNQDTYDLAIANLVLGEQVVEWQPALAELVRVTKPGGQVLTTLPLSGTWGEVEDMFEEVLRDEDMRREVATLQMLRRRRPTPSQVVAGLHEIGLTDRDFVVEHERFELLFRSGREFLFAPVIEHGPLRLWKAIIGRAEKPQALFWRFKEAIDTYYAGHVLAVTVVAGLVRVRVPGGPPDNFSTNYWNRYPSLTKLWDGAADDADSDDEFDLDLDIDIDLDGPDAASEPLAADAAAESHDEAHSLGFADAGPGFSDMEVSGASELPAIEDVVLSDDDDDLFAGLLEELDAEEAAAAEIAAADAKVEAAVPPPQRQPSGRAATLGGVEHSPLPGKLPPKPSESGISPISAKPPVTGSVPVPFASRLSSGPKPSESGISPIPGKLPPPPTTGEKLPVHQAGSGSLASRLPRRTGSGLTAIPPIPGAQAEVAAPGESLRPKTDTKSLLARLRGDSQRHQAVPIAKPPPTTGSSPVVPEPEPEPEVTKLGEPDPFASMLDDADDADEEFEEFDDLEDSLISGELEDDDDLADSFGSVTPEPTAGRSGSRQIPPPPPGRNKKK